MRKLAENSSSRNAINAFWCLKMNFEIGKLMYQQSRFDSSIAIFNQFIKEAQIYEEEYYKIYAKGYRLRCMLKLG